ncbi:MAG: CPBP family intramembrane metalloprotease [Oscillospiraceae bacterium]|nr:CPBP family intramembrane metalloprotease [Oscillospiraceae bacterium]
MKKLYEKSELTFALAWIGIYCVLQSLANPLNRMLGVEYSASAALCILQAVAIFTFVRKNGLMERYGLCRTTFPARRFLYYIPLLLLASRNFWNGVAVNLSPAGTACYILCMLGVGFVEEMIFRGFLFRAMEKDNARSAILVSSVTFGLGHLLNLVNGSGATLAENLFQVTGAIAIGFCFVILFYRGGSLWPCIFTHAAINISSAFTNVAGLTVEKRMVFHLLLFVITVGYAVILTRTLPPKERA